MTSRAMFALALLAVLTILAAFTPPQKPARIYLRDGTIDVCGRTSTGWSCRPASAVTAFLAGDGRDDCSGP